VLAQLLDSKYAEAAETTLGIDPEQSVDLDTLMQGFI